MAKATIRTRGAVIYTRVSTDDQDRHGTSPETQLSDCRNKAAELGLPIVAEYHDGGVSGGFFEHRPGVQSALADVREGRADTIIATELDRLSRDVEHQQRILKTVRAAKGRLVFCAGTFEDTPEGDLNYTMQGGFKQFEKTVIRRRTMKGKRKKLENGLQPSRGNHPFGYRVPTKEDVMRGDYPLEQLGRYVILPDQAEVVRWAFGKYAAGGMSLPEIARDLNRRGVPTARGGSHWRAANFHFIFANPVYKGTPMGGRWQAGTDESRLGRTNELTGRPIVSAKHYHAAPPENWVPLNAPAIVDEATWERVQARMKTNKQHRGGNPQRLKLLSGRVVCPGCGGGMNFYQYRDRPCYRCSRRRQAMQDTGEAVCQPTAYRADHMERDITLGILFACLHPEWIAAAMAAHKGPDGPPDADPRRELAALDRALDELGRQEAAAVQAQIAGIRAGASSNAYAAVFADLAGRRKDMEDRRGGLSRSLRAPGRGGGGHRPKAEEIHTQALQDVHTALTSPDLPTERKRLLLGMVVESVTPAKDGCLIRFVPGVFGEDTLQNTLRFYINKLTRDLEETVLTRQLLARLVAYNFPPGTPVPSLRFGRIDDDRLAVVGGLITGLVAGGVVAPGEPWIREYLGLPARGAGPQ